MYVVMVMIPTVFKTLDVTVGDCDGGCRYHRMSHGMIHRLKKELPNVRFER